MRITAVYFAICTILSITGCTTPPKPPECSGAYKPVNLAIQKEASFDGTGKEVRCEKEVAHARQG